jgi:DNA-directed RNA polymerase subunit RPC12/RpoP
MREFKFNCPVCGQHIKSNVTQSGTTMECPTCFQRIIVPPAPESDDPKYIVTATRYTEKKLPTGDPRSRTGALKDNIPAARPSKPKVIPIVIAVVVVLILGAAAFLFRGKLSGLASGGETRWVADALTGVEGSPVFAWKDKINGIPAAQSRPDGMPTVHLHSMNGHNVVRFSASTHEFLGVQAADSPMNGAQDFSVLVVFSTSTFGTTGDFYNTTGLVGGDQSGVVPDWAICVNGSQLGAGLGAGNAAANADVSLSGGPVVDGRPHIGLYVRSGSSATLYLDGSQVAGQTDLSTVPRGNYGFQIGAMSAESGFFTGDIAEIQIYKRALTDQEILKTVQELSKTYGVGAGQAAPATAVQSAPVEANPPLPAEISAGRVGVGTWDTFVAVSNVVVTSGGKVLYTSDFSGGKPKNWTIGSGKWVFGDGLMEQLAMGQGPMAVVGEDTWTNYIYKAQVAKLGGSEGFLLLFNFKNINSYAQFNVGGWGNSLTGIEYVQNGNKTTGPRVPGSVKLNQWYNVELDVNGPNVRCYVDGQLVIKMGE